MAKVKPITIKIAHDQIDFFGAAGERRDEE